MNNGKRSCYFSRRSLSCQAGTDVTVMATFLLTDAVFRVGGSVLVAPCWWIRYSTCSLCSSETLARC